MTGASFPVEIGGIAAGGAGVGRLPDGRAVFVHRTAPGEEVTIELTEEKTRWARGRLLEVVRPSDDRRRAPCPYYDRCGGCTLQHLAYEAQLPCKGRILTDGLERIGGMEAIEPPEVSPSPREFGYRSRITVTLRRLRGQRVVAGFHEIERPGRVFDLVGDCLLAEEEIHRVWGRIRAEWGSGAVLLPAGRELRLTLRSLEEGILLVVEGGASRGDPEALLDRVDGLVSIWTVDGSGRTRVTGLEDLTEEFLDERVRVRGKAFLQVNRGAGEELQRWILARVGNPEGLHVVDGYCGLGVLGRLLARNGARVTGLELEPDAVRCARSQAPREQEIREGRVEELLPGVLPADLAILNPPRAGIHADVPPVLVERGPPRLIYVSCDPATLARDLDRLSDRYALEELHAFDLFPQTAHVESVAVLGERS